MIKNDSNSKMKMPKFNLNWVYTIIIATLAFLFFKGGDTESNKTTSYTMFKVYVTNGYAQKIIVNKGEGTVVMEVKPEFSAKLFPKDKKKALKAPTVTAEYPSIDKVDDFVNEVSKAGKFKGQVSYEPNSNFFGGLLMNILPILLLVGVWIFVMRKMGGGGGGGANGVFSVGKSKARLFENGA
ncbi:MAG: cell division protein FtsH, partial [Bacteroidaceae bacterium]